MAKHHNISNCPLSKAGYSKPFNGSYAIGGLLRVYINNTEKLAV
jgi:hypothetical protein